MIRVVNKRPHRGPGEYIGRPSPLGNPFVIGRHGDRDLVIARYKEWLVAQCKAGNEPVKAELRRLLGLARAGDVNLVCWCAPERCHGDVIKAVLESKL